MTTDKVVGVSLGGLMGLLSGFIIDNTVLTTMANPRTFKNLLISSGKIVVTIVGLWFGVGAGTSWASSQMFGYVLTPTVAAWYFISLFVFVLLTTGFVLVRFVIFAGNSIPTRPAAGTGPGSS